MYVKLEGSYQEVLSILGLPFNPGIASAKETKEQINRDLPRSPLVSFTKSFKDLKESWQAEDVSLDFIQGNITGDVFGSVLSSLFIGAECHNSQLAEWLATNKTLEINAEAHEKILMEASNTAIKFAYFNDKNVPCGLSINYIKDHPDLWIATVMTNTVAEPEERRVMMYGISDIFNAAHQIYASTPFEFTGVSDPKNEFLAVLDSPGIACLLADILNNDNTIHAGNLENLKRRITTGANIDNWDGVIDTLDSCIEEVGLTQSLSEERDVDNVKDILYSEAYFMQQSGSEETVKNFCTSRIPELVDQISRKEEAIRKIPTPINAEPTFVQRNYGALSIALAGTLLAIAAICLLTGILTPLGITLSALATGLIIAGGSLGAALATVSCLKIMNSEKEHLDYEDAKFVTEKHCKSSILESSRYLSRLSRLGKPLESLRSPLAKAEQDIGAVNPGVIDQEEVSGNNFGASGFPG